MGRAKRISSHPQPPPRRAPGHDDGPRDGELLDDTPRELVQPLGHGRRQRLAETERGSLDPVHHGLAGCPAERPRERQRVDDGERVRRGKAETAHPLVALAKDHTVQGAGRCAGADGIDDDEQIETGEVVDQAAGVLAAVEERDAGGGEPVGDEHAGGVVAAVAVAEAGDGGSHRRSMVTFRKCVAQEMQGS